MSLPSNPLGILLALLLGPIAGAIKAVRRWISGKDIRGN